MIKNFKVYDREDLEEQDPWSGILAAIMFGVRVTYHTTLEATPLQLVFGRDEILPMQHQKLINDNNIR